MNKRAYQTYNWSLPQPEAALLNGIPLEQDNDLPADLQKAFRDTDTAHTCLSQNTALFQGLS
jgi:hypothetical protein